MLTNVGIHRAHSFIVRQRSNSLIELLPLCHQTPSLSSTIDQNKRFVTKMLMKISFPPVRAVKNLHINEVPIKTCKCSGFCVFSALCYTIFAFGFAFTKCWYSYYWLHAKWTGQLITICAQWSIHQGARIVKWMKKNSTKNPSESTTRSTLCSTNIIKATANPHH